MTTQRGLSLLEVALAVSVGLMLTAGGVYAYRQHMHATRVTQAKLMLATIRQEIAAHRYRTGTYPTADMLKQNKVTIAPGNDRSFYGPVGSPLRDPLNPPMDGAARSEIRTLPAEATGSPWGGWGYNPTTGTLEPNLDPEAFPGDRPSSW